MNVGEFYLFLRNGFRSQGGDAMLKRMFGLLLRLFAVCMGLLAGVAVEICRADCLLVPYGLVLIFFFGVVFVQFSVFAGVRLVINKIFNLRLRQGAVRYFLIAFVYSIGYGIIADFVPYRIADNGLVMFVVLPALVFSAIVAVEVLLLRFRNKKATSM